MDFHRDAVLSKPGDDFVACNADVVGVFATEGGEALDEGPGLVERDI
jgi:hypothetical protein